MRHFTAVQICKALKEHGWFFDRQTGSHAQYKHPDFTKLITVPMHKGRTLPPGLQKSILTTAELSEDDVD